MSDDLSRRELAEFLRSRRARLRPEDVDIKTVGRRRTPGLRREEVASLANIGVTWYTWLEQGRAVHPSASVAKALAHALRLSEPEKLHFQALLRRTGNEEVSTATSSPLESFARHFESPAYVRDRNWDILFSNSAADRYFDGFAPDILGRANLIGYLFLNERARHTYVDWKEVASRSVAQFRRMTGAAPSTSRAAEIVEYVRAQSREFANLWDSFVVTDFYVGQRILRDEVGSEVSFTYATLTSPNAPYPLLTIYLPERAAM